MNLSYFQFNFISGPLFPNVDDSLNAYNYIIKSEFSRRWSKHKCDVPGCSTVLIFDGGCKATRKICGAVKSEVREFSATGFKVITGKDSQLALVSLFSSFIKVVQTILHQERDSVHCIMITNPRF